MTLSENYHQTILTYSELISNNVHTLTWLLPNNSKHFFETLEQTESSKTENSPVKVRKVSIHT